MFSFSISPLVENLFNVIPRQMFSFYFFAQQCDNRQVIFLLKFFCSELHHGEIRYEVQSEND